GKCHHIQLQKLFLFCICILLTSVVHIGNFGFLGVFISYSWAYNSPLNIIAAVSLFGLFLKINFQSNIINIFSSSAFAVFLIHGDYNIMDFLLNISKMIYFNPLALYAGTVFLVLVIWKLSPVIHPNRPVSQKKYQEISQKRNVALFAVLLILLKEWLLILGL
ncbi:accessory gene regulator B family protein, partial [Thomasclavelia cocleata]|uniref:accessory gene regulator B family protein n=1 Tax=Thomasclavelia cocleata TaxID=69824 RepID=UPI00257713BF